MDSRRANAVRAEINVTPLVDVVLVLLIIFMVRPPCRIHGPASPPGCEVTRRPLERERRGSSLSIDRGESSGSSIESARGRTNGSPLQPRNR
jgi:biopolymer transport protein ExbD